MHVLHIMRITSLLFGRMYALYKSEQAHSVNGNVAPSIHMAQPKQAKPKWQTHTTTKYRSQNTFVVTLKFNGIHGEISLVPVSIYAYTRFAYLINELIMNVPARMLYVVVFDI